MRVHFAQVMEVHEAVIRGDLAAVKEPANELTGLPDGMTPRTKVDTSVQVAALRRAAGDAAAAETLFQAAMASARMLKACGDCHRAADVAPAAPIAASPAIGGVVGHMLRHQEALDRMLNGLVVPSDVLWRSGTEALKVAPMRKETLPRDSTLTEPMVASEDRIHQLAAQAGAAKDAGARAVFYGNVIARCADCHAAHRTIWGPSRR